MAKQLAKSFNCPTEFTLSVLGGKWKTVILCYLKQQPCRYSDLRRLLPALSEKMLTERLRDLTLKGLVIHTRDSKTRSSTYSLTAKGRSLGDLLHHIYDWGRLHAKDFDVQVGEPLTRLNEERTAS
jgi:DNA-binding HxlR family transcriptional regulator